MTGMTAQQMREAVVNGMAENATKFEAAGDRGAINRGDKGRHGRDTSGARPVTHRGRYGATSWPSGQKNEHERHILG